MKVAGCTSFGLFALLAISLVLACNEFESSNFADDGSGSSDVPRPGVNVLPPILPSLSSEGAPSIDELSLVQVPFAEMLPSELWQEIFPFCTLRTLLLCSQVCCSWKNAIINSKYYMHKLCMLVVEDEANFDRLLLVLEQKSREEQKVLLQRIHDEKLVSPKVLMDLIVRLFMVDDVFSIVRDLLGDPNILMSKLFARNCRVLSVDKVLKDPQRAKAILKLTPELLDAVLKDLTPENFCPWLSLPLIFDQLMEKATDENAALALQIYRQLKGAVHLPADDFPTLSCIEPLLPLFFLFPSNDENGQCMFLTYMYYSKFTKMRSSEEVMPKEMADKILDILSLVEINEQSMKLLVPYLCPSFLKGWKEHETDVGKRIIDQFLEISLQFKKLNGGVAYGMALMAIDLPVIQGAINSLAKIDSVPFFVYRPLIVRYISWVDPRYYYRAAQVPFNGIEYPQCFMEHLCVLALFRPKSVYHFLLRLDRKQRSSLLSYSTVLTSSLFSRFKENGLDCDVFSAVPSSL